MPEHLMSGVENVLTVVCGAKLTGIWICFMGLEMTSIIILAEELKDQVRLS